MKIGQQVAQGDVFITRVADIPENAIPVERDNGRVVLAYGEVTGHAHAIVATEAELLVAPNRTAEEELLNVRFLRVMRTLEVTHEEHGALTLEPGLYRVNQQREWSDAEEPLRVAD